MNRSRPADVYVTGGAPGDGTVESEDEEVARGVSTTIVAASVTIVLLIVLCCLLGCAKHRNDQKRATDFNQHQLKMAVQTQADIEYDSVVSVLSAANPGDEPTYSVPDKTKKKKRAVGKLSPIPEYAMASWGNDDEEEGVAYDLAMQHPASPEYAMAASGGGSNRAAGEVASYDLAAQQAPDPEYALASNGSLPSSPAPVSYAMASSFATPGKYDTGMGDDMYFAGTLFSPAKSPGSMYQEASYNMATDVAMPVYDMAGADGANKRHLRFLSPRKEEEHKSVTAFARDSRPASSNASEPMYHAASNGPAYELATGPGNKSAVARRIRGGITQNFAKRQSIVLQKRFSRIESKRGRDGATKEIKGGMPTNDNGGPGEGVGGGDDGGDGSIFKMLRTLTMTQKRFSKHEPQIEVAADYLQPVQQDPNRESPEYALASSTAADARDAIGGNENHGEPVLMPSPSTPSAERESVYPLATKENLQQLSYADDADATTPQPPIAAASAGMITPPRSTAVYREIDLDASIAEAANLPAFDACMMGSETPQYATIEDAPGVEGAYGTDGAAAQGTAVMTPVSDHGSVRMVVGHGIQNTDSPVYCEIGTPLANVNGLREAASPIYQQIGTPLGFPRDRKTVRFAVGSPLQEEPSPVYHEVGTPMVFPSGRREFATLRVAGGSRPPMLQSMSPPSEKSSKSPSLNLASASAASSVGHSAGGGYASTSTFRREQEGQAQYTTLRSISATPHTAAGVYAEPAKLSEQLDVAELRHELKSSAFGNVEGMEMEELMELVLALEEGAGDDAGSAHQQRHGLDEIDFFDVLTDEEDDLDELQAFWGGTDDAAQQFKSGPIALSPSPAPAAAIDRARTASRYVDMFAQQGGGAGTGFAVRNAAFWMTLSEWFLYSYHVRL